MPPPKKFDPTLGAFIVGMYVAGARWCEIQRHYDMGRTMAYLLFCQAIEELDLEKNVLEHLRACARRGGAGTVPLDLALPERA